MNIFLCKGNLFGETAKEALVLNNEVINDVIMMQYIY